MKLKDIEEAYRLSQILHVLNMLEDKLNSNDVRDVEFPIRVDAKDVINLIVPAELVLECMLNPLRTSVSATLGELGVDLKDNANVSGGSDSIQR